MSELTYQEAVHLFETWGFQVEPGPRKGEVTLLLETPEFCTSVVHPKALLPQMAAVASAVRWRNGCVMEQVTQQLPIPCC